MALKGASKTGLLDLSLVQTDKYEEALRQGISRLWADEDPKAILDEVAKRRDAITQQVGVDKQRAVYRAWASKSGAYPKSPERCNRGVGIGKRYDGCSARPLHAGVVPL